VNAKLFKNPYIIDFIGIPEKKCIIKQVIQPEDCRE